MNEENMYADDGWSYGAAHFGLYGNEGAGGRKPASRQRGSITNKRHSTKKETAVIETQNWMKQKESVELPILMYHSISSGNSLRVPKSEFAKDNDYVTLSPEEAYRVFTTNTKPSEKTVLITFDDGYTDNYTKAFPILKQYGMKATIFMIEQSIGHPNHLTDEMMAHGISIESHTIHHLELNRLSKQQQEEELKGSKTFFDQRFSQRTRMVSYPVGRYNERDVEAGEGSRIPNGCHL